MMSAHLIGNEWEGYHFWSAFEDLFCNHRSLRITCNNIISLIIVCGLHSGELRECLFFLFCDIYLNAKNGHFVKINPFKHRSKNWAVYSSSINAIFNARSVLKFDQLTWNLSKYFQNNPFIQPCTCLPQYLFKGQVAYIQHVRFIVKDQLLQQKYVMFRLITQLL